MARIIHGTLFAPVYELVSPGVWNISNATYTNVSDDTGVGAYAIQNGFIVYVPAANINTGLPIPGVVHRYRITDHMIMNASTLSCIITWDEGGSEIDRPHNGDYAIISEVGTGQGLAFPVSNQVYPLMKAGMDIAAIAVEEKVKIDKIASSVAAKIPERTVITSGIGTYTVPSGALCLKVTMCGGGGGGGGAGTTVGSNGNPGVTTTFGTNSFGTNLLIAGGGGGGVAGSFTVYGAGGTYSINSPAVGYGVEGGWGGTAWNNRSVQIAMPGGAGGSSAFGQRPVSFGGSTYDGGNPASTYDYWVGNGGLGGSAGSFGYSGRNGVDGILIIDAYFQ